ncbi:glycosyltransferase [Fumia xinanensis]|uniref:Glycosyltransferase n=1 Tax=Fumia xinanensis TaxID=2763659 RepID=A0A926E5X9_9FIRM|nr:glycosyltransferase [Fumia xinanensis]MBC8560135.1 glycosyltransferase [Fumia xinanensis]PWL45480.1 MAG: hypothetical protein DBY45_04005 [Clostridiales bacterium]
MKKILIIYTEMIIGGATSALLSLLHSLDYEKYSVDLQLYSNGGIRQGEIPKEVHILPEADPYTHGFWQKAAGKLLSPCYIGAKVRAVWQKSVKKRPLSAVQVMTCQAAKAGQKAQKSYDTAVSFLEFWPLYYLAFQVEAKRKVSWIHIDYKKSTLSVSLDEEAFAQCDKIVLVSKQCLDNFRELCPKFAGKAVWTENIVSPGLIRRAAGKAQPELPGKASPDVIRLVTVSRVDFSHKGLDRGIEAFRRLKEEGLAGRFQWVVIGDGDDLEAFQEMISENGLESLIFPLGMKPEPLPYLKQADAFFLPSRYEGKPISVSEAQILGVPPLVCAYESAREQIWDGIDGLVFENSGKGVYEGLRRLAEQPEILSALGENLLKRDFADREAIEAIDRIIGGTS